MSSIPGEQLLEVTALPEAPVRPRSFMARVFADAFGRTSAKVGTVWIVIVTIGAVFAPFLASSHPYVMKSEGKLSFPLFRNLQPVDVVFFRHLTSDDGSVRHTGDNLVGGTGQGGDDESILVDLQRVPVHIDQIVFTVNSFTGQTFAEVQNAFCRLVDETNGQELARYTLNGGGPFTAQIMAKVERGTSGWSMTAIGTPANGRTFQDLIPAILPAL